MDKNAIANRLATEAPGKFRYDYEVIPGSGIRTNGRMKIDYNHIFKRLGFQPRGFAGKRVLEIGAFDGALTFWLEDQGAEVVAIDVQEPSLSGFSLVHDIRQSKARYEIMSIYDLDPNFIGTFDCITCFGVFYHLKYPILAFERLNSVCNQGGRLFCGGALGEAFFYNDTMTDGCDFRQFTRENAPAAFHGQVSKVNDLPYCAFVENEWLHDKSNWHLPNARCVQAWLKRTGFRTDASHVSYSAIQQNPGHDYSKLGLPPVAEGAARASGHFAATRFAVPEPEFEFSGYVGRNIIPTRLEMEALQQRVKELEAQLEQSSEK